MMGQELTAIIMMTFINIVLITAKHVGHAPTARKVVSTREYGEPCWHYESRKTCLAIGACPTCFCNVMMVEGTHSALGLQAAAETPASSGAALPVIASAPPMPQSFLVRSWQGITPQEKPRGDTQPSRHGRRRAGLLQAKLKVLQYLRTYPRCKPRQNATWHRGGPAKFQGPVAPWILASTHQHLFYTH